jgi:tetratricopeptide (TPR) repeat protein
MAELTLNVPESHMHMMPQIISDLEASQKALKEAESQNAPDRDVLTENFALALIALYEVSREPNIMERAIELQEEILRYRPSGHPLHVATLEKLGIMIWTMRGRHGSSLARLTRVVEIRRELLQSSPLDDPLRPISLKRLADALLGTFTQVGDLSVLEKAIELLREALTLCPAGHPERESALNNLASTLLIKYRSNREAEDETLRQILALHRECISYLPPGNPYRARALNNMAVSLITSYKSTRNINELQEAIHLLRECVQLFAPGHSSRDSSLNTLGFALMLEYGSRPDSDTLRDALDILGESLSLRPPGHPYRASSIINLSEALTISFRHEGKYNNVEEAVGILREAVVLCPPGHAWHQHSVNQLGLSLLFMFEYSYDFAALAEAISLFRKVLIAQGYPEIADAASLNNLACALFLKYNTDVDHDPKILEEAIGYQRQVLQLRPPGHTERHLSLNALGISLHGLSMVGGDIILLHEAISYLSEALDLRPPGHPNRATTLHNLGQALSSLYDQNEEVEVLKQSIGYCRESLLLRPQGHSERHKSITNLGFAIRKLHDRTQEPALLNEENKLYEDSLGDYPVGHPFRGRLLCLLAARRLVPGTSLFDFKSGAEFISESLIDKSSSMATRITDAIPLLRKMEVAYHISLHDKASNMSNEWNTVALKAYDRFINLLPLYAALGKQRAIRLRLLTGVEGVIRDGATRAIGTNLALDNAPKVLEILEQGFGLFWQQALQLKSPDLNTLPDRDCSRLQDIFRILNTDLIPDVDNYSQSLYQVTKDHQEQQLEQRRQLGDEADRIIERIRLDPERNHFLRPPSWQDMSLKLPVDTHVVILVSSSVANYAMIISKTGDHTVKSTPLRFSGIGIAGVLRNTKGIYRGGLVEGEDYSMDLGFEATKEVIKEGDDPNTRAMLMDRTNQPKNLEKVLANLFELIVKPVVNSLGLKVSITYQQTMCLY